jgi:hypothetical protein
MTENYVIIFLGFMGKQYDIRFTEERVVQQRQQVFASQEVYGSCIRNEKQE